MPLIALGINHQTAPVALREQLALDSAQAREALQDLTQQPGVDAAAIISTCNRTELYARVELEALDLPRDFLRGLAQHKSGQMDEFFYQHQDAEAVRHLFRVATGLDSLVLGEPQILGQVKDAYQLAREVGSLSAPLERLFQNTFAVAKKVRSETRIGAHPVSVAFAAVRMAERIFADMRGVHVLLLGAGETIELTARHLHQLGCRHLTVANRTLANAQALAQSFNAQAATLNDLNELLPGADVVIASTASREPLITLAMTKSALKARKHRPIFMLDLAVPRDIAAEVGHLDDVYLYTVDDLGQVIEENLRSRQAAAIEAEALIDLHVDHFMGWLRGQDGADTLRRLRANAERERDQALARAREALAQGRAPEVILETLAHQLTNKLMHTPMSNLRHAAMRGERDLLQAADRLFEAGPEIADANSDSPLDTNPDHESHS